jgi:hypothetical protein
MTATLTGILGQRVTQSPVKQYDPLQKASLTVGEIHGPLYISMYRMMTWSSFPGGTTKQKPPPAPLVAPWITSQMATHVNPALKVPFAHPVGFTVWQ